MHWGYQTNNSDQKKLKMAELQFLLANRLTVPIPKIWYLYHQVEDSSTNLLHHYKSNTVHVNQPILKGDGQSYFVILPYSLLL
jgi:hypothetical protein